MARKTGPDRATVDVVWERAGGLCERCGGANGPAVDVHHRRPRGAGGSKSPTVNLPSNLVVLCRADHEWIEVNRETAMGEGWLLSKLSPVEAWSVPVATWYGPVLLDRVGGWVKV